MDVDKLKRELQRHLSDGLVTIVGSGLSCAEGLPGMDELANHLRAVMPTRVAGPDTVRWSEIESDLDKLGLESALLKHAPTPTLESEIMTATVALILPREQHVLRQVIGGGRTLRFTRLLKHMLKPPNGLPVVTTNYDRLIEVAAEAAGLGVNTMFVGGYCGALNEKEARASLCREASLKNRTVHLKFRDHVTVYKPHGSLDWFQKGDGPIRYAGDLPLQRLLITPGLNKFRNGYESPFDKHRDRANSAVDRASRFLIIGYGFNDDHLETHLKPMLRSGKPAILLTRTVSDAARAAIVASPNMIALERAEDGGKPGTRVSRKGGQEFLPDLDIWDLNGFVDEVLE